MYVRLPRTNREVPKKIQTKRQNLLIFWFKDANGMANSEDPDQTAPLGSRSALFAQNCLSKNLGSLWYLPVSISESVQRMFTR